jgi:hypothetical protein
MIYDKTNLNQPVYHLVIPQGHSSLEKKCPHSHVQVHLRLYPELPVIALRAAQSTIGVHVYRVRFVPVFSPRAFIQH